MGMNMAAMMLLVVGIAVLANYVAARRHHRFDFTRSKQHTLSSQTLKILKSLKKNITLTAFYSRRSPGSQFGETQDLLDEYRYGSDRVKTRIVDIYTNPAEAQRYAVTSPSVTIVESGGRKEQVYGPNEQDLTTAILKVTREEKLKVYFLLGQGEHDPGSFGGQGYAEAKRALEAAYYQVETLNVVGAQGVPKDCAVLVVAGPQKPLDAAATGAIVAYLEQGGRAFFLVDPDPAPSLADILEKWGVKPLPGTVVEPALTLGPGMIVIAKYLYHDITRPFTERPLAAILATARAFERVPTAPPDLHAADVMQTSSDSWLAAGLAGSTMPAYKAGEKRGPLTVMMAVSMGAPPTPPGMPELPEQPKEKPVLVVAGDSDFASDDLIANGANKDLFMNSINWLAGQTELVSIAPKPREEHTIMLDQVQARQTFVLAVLAVPVVVLCIGGYVWWRRR